jgi:hypothetical protein
VLQTAVVLSGLLFSVPKLSSQLSALSNGSISALWKIVLHDTKNEGTAILFLIFFWGVEALGDGSRAFGYPRERLSLNSGPVMAFGYPRKGAVFTTAGNGFRQPVNNSNVGSFPPSIANRSQGKGAALRR